MDEALHDDLLMRYIDGEMDATERGAFESRLQQDASLKEQLERLQVAVAAVVQAGITGKVKGIHQDMMTELRKEKKTVIAPVRKFGRVGLAIAASVAFLLVILAGWQFYQLSPEKLYTENRVTYTVSNTRGLHENAATLSQSYSQKNYEVVIQNATQTTLSTEDSLLVGLACLETKRIPSAILWLEAVRNGNGPYKQDAEYYLSMAYLRNGEYDKALQLMQQIHADTHHVYHQEVTNGLLRKVRLLKWK